MTKHAEHPLHAALPSAGRPATEAVRRHTMADDVYERLREAIFSGRFPAGTELNQVDLARLYGVSRVPVREALRRLQAERLLVANPFQRYAVSVLRPKQVLELHDIRGELEVFALKQALKEPPDVVESRITAALNIASEMQAGTPMPDWLRLDRDFHLALNGPSTAVAGMIEDLRDRVHRYLQIADLSPARVDQVVGEHHAIIKALRAGSETRVETAIRSHVDRTRDVLERTLVGDSHPDES